MILVSQYQEPLQEQSLKGSDVFCFSQWNKIHLFQKRKKKNRAWSFGKKAKSQWALKASPLTACISHDRHKMWWVEMFYWDKLGESCFCDEVCDKVNKKRLEVAWSEGPCQVSWGHNKSRNLYHPHAILSSHWLNELKGTSNSTLLLLNPCFYDLGYVSMVPVSSKESQGLGLSQDVTGPSHLCVPCQSIKVV
jgi:hypothetical protein